jgi:hypothetical protein
MPFLTKYFSKGFLQCVAGTLLGLFLSSCALSSSSFSVPEELSRYGFSDPKQVKALESLFQQASLIPLDCPLTKAFPARSTSQEVALDLIFILQETQKKFVVRSGTQERWEAQTLKWMKQNPDNILSDLKVLGFVEEISPRTKTVDAVCILGGATFRMADRIAYANAILQSGVKSKTLILLAGERPVTKGVDGSEETLVKVAHTWKLSDWTHLTETHMIQEEYAKSDLFKQNLDVHVIDTPKGDLPRPTTQTSLLHLIAWLKHHPEVKTLLFVSNQPYVAYQKAIIDTLFRQNDIKISSEVVGSAVKNTDDLQPLLEGLGSYLWAATPTVLLDMKATLTDKGLRDSLKHLYGKNPFLYQALPL